MEIRPYLTFNGDCNEALALYKRAFKTDMLEVMRFSDMPKNPAWAIPDEYQNRIVQATLKFGENFIRMSDCGPRQPPANSAETERISIAVETDADAARHAFAVLAEEGRVGMELSETFYSPCAGVVFDKFGVMWNFSTPNIRELVKEYAIENFKSGLNCAESVFEALQRSGAIKVPPETIAMCVGFGGGIGVCGHTCGALSAAIMAVGSVHGRRDPKSVAPEIRSQEAAQKYYRRYNKLVHDFEQAAGAVSCSDITGSFEDWHGKERRVCCLKLIGKTAGIAYDSIMMPQEEAFVLPYGDNIAGLE